MYLFLVAISINICRSLKFTELQWLQFISVWSEEARRDPESELSQKFRTADLFDEYSPVKNNNIDDYPSASNLTITLNIRLSLCNWANHYISNIFNIYSTKAIMSHVEREMEKMSHVQLYIIQWKLWACITAYISLMENGFEES